MALTISTPSQDSLKALEAAAAQFSGVINISQALHANASEGTLPHQVFTVGLTDLSDRSWVEKARLVGWRYLLQGQNGVAMAAEVNASSSGDQGVSLNEGPFVEQTADLLADARASQNVEDGDYEFAVLRIPAIYVMALWLKSRNSGDDIFIPMGPTLEELEPGREYRLDEITPILVAAAKDALAFDNAPRS